VIGQLGQALVQWTLVPPVAESLSAARAAIDDLLWRRDIRAAAGQVALASTIRGARESAAMEGADIAHVEDSPMGRVLLAAQAVTGEAPLLADTWTSAPLQVLARLHTLAAHDHLAPDLLGRPRIAGEVSDDPLHLGPAPANPAQRLSLLADLATDSADVPAVAVAGIAHAELVGGRPFVWGSGLVGRAIVRVVFAARGVDPSLFSIPEAGMMQVGRPAYVRALRDYESGKVDEYLRWFASAVALGAQCASAEVPGQA
jgi:hypothetical protein